MAEDTLAAGLPQLIARRAALLLAQAWANTCVTLCVFFALDTFTSHRSDLGRRTVYFLALFVLIGATVAYAVTLPQVREVIDYRTRLQDYDEDRFATWAKAFELGMEYPLGVGPGRVLPDTRLCPA